MKSPAPACIAWLVLLAAPLPADSGRWTGRWNPEPATGNTNRPEIEIPSLTREKILTDVEGRLAPEVFHQQESFLRAQAEESKIGLHVFVFDGESLAGDTSGLESALAGAQAAAVLYFLGEPQRAGLYFGPELAGAVTEVEQRRALQSSIMQAADKADPDAQLEAFLSQMSIRLYWMERMLDDALPMATNLPAIPRPAAKPRTSEMIPAAWHPWLAGGAAVILALPLVAWIHRRRARYRLPVFEIEPRLGGDHAAGVGGVISFLNAEVPPAAQREQISGNPWRR